MPKSSPSRIIRIKRYCVGGFLLFMGVLGGLLPILQGWIFTALGLLVLRNDVRWARKCIIWVKRRYPKSRPAFKAAEDRIDRFMKRFGLLG